jgi:hypothetical protein
MHDTIGQPSQNVEKDEFVGREDIAKVCSIEYVLERG